MHIIHPVHAILEYYMQNSFTYFRSCVLTNRVFSSVLCMKWFIRSYLLIVVALEETPFIILPELTRLEGA